MVDVNPPHRHESILTTIGRTPVVRLHALAPDHVRLYAKLEAFNPMGSIKDRLALALVEAAEASGELRPGQTVIEATSGNTGIGLAMVCAAKGYPLVIVMSENFSIERRKLLRFLGAKVVLTPAAARGSGMITKAKELADAHGWFWTRQFESQANADVHARTTAEELLESFADTTIDYWVTGFGTGGTLQGVARTLRAKSPRTRVVVCEPDNSQMLGSGIAQARAADGSVAASHPAARPHPVQGWAPDFVPTLVDGAAGTYDRLVAIDPGEALRLARELAMREGIFSGISGGATLAGALLVARDAAPGSTIVCMIPDTGERYLSTLLFEDVPESMTDEEWSIARSTPGVRFDVRAASSASASLGASDTEADAIVTGMLASRDPPVVVFGHAWCEFSMAVRNLLTYHRVPFLALDMDAAAYQADELGFRICRAVSARTGMTTVPLVFVGGEFVGGSTDFARELEDGSLARRLEALGVALRTREGRVAASFFPRWAHAR